MNEHDFYNLITPASPIVLFIGIVISIFYFRNLSNGFRVIFGYLLMSLFIDLLTRYFGFYSHLKYNLFLFPIFGFLELAFLSTLYYKYILHSKSIPLLLFIIFMLLLIVVDFVFFSKLFDRKSFQSFGRVISDSTIIYLAMIYYLKLVQGKVVMRSDINILNGTVIIYYSINLILYLFINFLVNASIQIITVFWMINLVTLIAFYLILIYLIWQDGKTPKLLR
jgi:hypothetical protein